MVPDIEYPKHHLALRLEIQYGRVDGVMHYSLAKEYSLGHCHMQSASEFFTIDEFKEYMQYLDLMSFFEVEAWKDNLVSVARSLQ